MSLGKWGEQLAADYLTAHGYLILERNLRTPHGELDLIAHQPALTDQASGNLVFVEVRTRASSVLGPPELSINQVKQYHVRQSVAYFLQTHPEQTSNLDWRIDVIAIRWLDRNAEPELTHFENAFA